MPLPSGFQGSAITLGQTQVFLPELWTGEVRIQRDSIFVMREAVKLIDFTGRKGDTIHIPGISRLGVYPKVAEQMVNLQAKTETEFVMQVDQHKECSFAVEDIVAVQEDYNLMSHYRRELAYALARDLDNFILGYRAAVNVAATRIYVTDTGLANGVKQNLSIAAIVAAKEILDKADVPQEGRKLILAPAQLNDLLVNTTLTSRDFTKSGQIESGTFSGTLFGFELLVSNNIKPNTTDGFFNGDGTVGQPTPGVSGSPYLPSQGSFTPLDTTGGGSGNFTTAIACHPDWLALALQREPKITESWENLLQMSAVVGTQIYGARVFRPDHAVLIYTAS